MARYVTKPKAIWVEDDLYEQAPAYAEQITVFETDATPQPTGIYDADGNELFKVNDREPIGFRIRR